MNIIPIISKKSNNLELTKDEVYFFVNEYVNGNIEDYQMASLLMAIKINGLTDDELIHYTNAMLETSLVFPVENNYVDKHSTGGIGDKTTIALLPILSAMDLKIFKISGRGLGFTGGTIDKLESLKGFNTNLSMEEVKKNIDDIGMAITSQTKDLVPADGKIYALRDITGTIDSPPLIAASIMSKKIASGSKNIFIDLKFGSGSMTSTMDDVKTLSKYMKIIAKNFDRNLFILVSTMNQPLGKTIGNKIEIMEAVEFLKGNYSNDFYELIAKISTELYAKVNNVSLKESKAKFDEVLNSGKAYNVFEQWIKKQGVKNPKEELVFEPKFKKECFATEGGYISFEDTKEFGNLLVKIKAGRIKKTDKLDYDSGLKLFVKTGDMIKKGQKLFEIYSSSEIDDNLIEELKNLFKFSKKKQKIKTIISEITW